MNANPAYQNRFAHVAAAATYTTGNNDSTSVDALGFNEAHVLYKFGTTTGTSGTATVLVIASDATGGTYAAISGATTAALTTDTGGQNDKWISIPITLVGKNRWLKIRVTMAGTASTGSSNGYIVLGAPNKAALPPNGGTAYDVNVSHVT